MTPDGLGTIIEVEHAPVIGVNRDELPRGVGADLLEGYFVRELRKVGGAA